MRCPRCHGRMIYDHFFSRCENYQAWRCINCGQILDGMIIQNRFLYGKKSAYLSEYERLFPLKLRR